MWGWSPEEQQAALEAAGKWDPHRAYLDILPAVRAKRPSFVKPEWLEDRNGGLLRQTTPRAEEIAVASLLALSPSEGDLPNALELAWKRGATVFAADSGLSFPPDSGVARAMADWQRAKAAARTKPGRTLGYLAAAEKKLAATERKLPAARRLWRDRSPDRLSAEQIGLEVGLSPKTLYNRLHARPPKRKGKL